MMAVVVRLVLLAVVGVAGWMLGGAVGGFVGAGLDMILVGARMPESGVAVSPFFWTCGWLGAIVGGIGPLIWLARMMGRSST